MLALRHKELITRNTGSEEDILLELLYSIVLVIHSCLTLCEPMCCVAFQVSLSMEFSRQAYWSELPFPSPGPTIDSHINFGFAGEGLNISST